MTDDPFLQILRPATHDLGGFKLRRALPHQGRAASGEAG